MRMVLPIRQFYLGLALRGSCQVGLIQFLKPQVGGSIPLTSTWVDKLRDFVNYHKGSINIYCAQDCARDGLYTTLRHPTAPYEAIENPL